MLCQGAVAEPTSHVSLGCAAASTLLLYVTSLHGLTGWRVEVGAISTPQADVYACNWGDSTIVVAVRDQALNSATKCCVYVVTATLINAWLQPVFAKNASRCAQRTA